jgi:hypothetical protein
MLLIPVLCKRGSGFGGLEHREAWGLAQSLVKVHTRRRMMRVGLRATSWLQCIVVVPLPRSVVFLRARSKTDLEGTVHTAKRCLNARRQAPQSTDSCLLYFAISCRAYTAHGVLILFSDRGLKARVPTIGFLAFDVLLPFQTRLIAIFEEMNPMHRHFSSQ